MNTLNYLVNTKPSSFNYQLTSCWCNNSPAQDLLNKTQNLLENKFKHNMSADLYLLKQFRVLYYDFYNNDACNENRWNIDIYFKMVDTLDSSEFTENEKEVLLDNLKNVFKFKTQKGFFERSFNENDKPEFGYHLETMLNNLTLVVTRNHKQN